MSKFAFWRSARPPGPVQASTPALLLGCMLLASPATAIEPPDTVQLHGFASQAYIKTTGNKYFGNSDKGSFDFRELGVSLSWQALPSLQLAAQAGIPGIFPDTVLPDIVQKGGAYYVQGTYLIATDWEALLRYDVHYRDKNDKSGVTAASASGAPAHSFFTKDLTVGLGWSVGPDTKIRAEWHRVNGTSWLSPRENPVAGDTWQYWDMFALQVSYSF